MLTLLNLVMLIGAGLLVLSALTSLISRRLGVPILLVFLAIGLLVGVDGPGGIDFDNAPLAYFVGSLAMAIILFDAGFETRWSTWQLAAAPGLVLASLGVLITAGLVGAAAVYLLEVDWVTGLLLGAIVASTDAAAVFLLLRMSGVTLRERVKASLEIESGSNDPVAIFLALGLVPLTGTPYVSDLVDFGITFVEQFTIGGIGGYLAGLAMVRSMAKVELEEGLAPLVIAGMAVAVFAAVNLLGGSGFLGVYVAGLVVGNGRLRGRAEVQRFQAGLTWLCQIALFLTLGLLATPSEFVAVALPALGVAAVLMFVARPLAVWLGLLPFDFTRQEVVFISWVGLRGAVSILLAIVPLVSGHPHSHLLFNVAFIIVLASLLFQGWTVRPLARWLKLIVPPRTGPVERVELTLPGDAQVEVVAYRVHGDSPIASGRPLPRYARPALLLRDGRMLEPQAARPRDGDRAYLFATPEQIPLLDRLFAGSAPIDPEDRLFYGDFQLSATTPAAELAQVYGLPEAESTEGRSLADLFAEQFGATVETGDRLRLGPLELVAIEVEKGHARTVGLLLDPPPLAKPFPYLPSGGDLLRLLRRRRAAKRSAAALPPPPPPAQSPDTEDKTDQGS